MKRFYLACLIGITCILGGCGGKINHINASGVLEPTRVDAEAAKEAYAIFALSASFQEDNIVIAESDSGDVINEIPIPFDKNSVFLSMTDEDYGYLLYCSTPACGQMMKYLYVTEDRWATYDEIDISSLIDGYPTSLSALSSEHVYVGAQMHNNGYLFETTDRGENWNSVSVDEGYYRDGYVPLIDENNGVMYALLEYVSDDGSHYNLYQSDVNAAAWEKIGSFSLDVDGSVFQNSFMSGGSLYLYDSQGNPYRIEI